MPDPPPPSSSSHSPITPSSSSQLLIISPRPPSLCPVHHPTPPSPALPATTKQPSIFLNSGGHPTPANSKPSPTLHGRHPPLLHVRATISISPIVWIHVSAASLPSHRAHAKLPVPAPISRPCQQCRICYPPTPGDLPAPPDSGVTHPHSASSTAGALHGHLLVRRSPSSPSLYLFLDHLRPQCSIIKPTEDFVLPSSSLSLAIRATTQPTNPYHHHPRSLSTHPPPPPSLLVPTKHHPSLLVPAHPVHFLTSLLRQHLAQRVGPIIALVN